MNWLILVLPDPTKLPFLGVNKPHMETIPTSGVNIPHILTSSSHQSSNPHMFPYKPTTSHTSSVLLTTRNNYKMNPSISKPLQEASSAPGILHRLSASNNYALYNLQQFPGGLLYDLQYQSVYNVGESLLQ